jgi:hypothetical protein
MCNGGISTASLSTGASLRASVLALALESSSALLSGANPPPLVVGEDLESPTPDIMDSVRAPLVSRLFLRCRHTKKPIALAAKATIIPPTPITIPIIVPDGIPLSVPEPGSSFWATVVLEVDDGVGASVLLPVPGAAVVVDGAEYVDPGTVGSVARMLRSDSCQRTWRAKASSEASVVCTHLLYE